MQLQITDGYITGYATLGGFVDGIDTPDDTLESCDQDALRRGCYQWVDGCAVLDEDKLQMLLAAERAAKIRARRETECFTIINRGSLWYDRLSTDQRAELDEWYQSWLDAPQTSLAPDAPVWLERKENE